MNDTTNSEPRISKPGDVCENFRRGFAWLDGPGHATIPCPRKSAMPMARGAISPCPNALLPNAETWSSHPNLTPGRANSLRKIHSCLQLPTAPRPMPKQHPPPNPWRPHCARARPVLQSGASVGRRSGSTTGTIGKGSPSVCNTRSLRIWYRFVDWWSQHCGGSGCARRWRAGAVMGAICVLCAEYWRAARDVLYTP